MQQKEKWSTKSIEAEWNASKNINLEDKMAEGETEPLTDFGDHQEEENEKLQAETVAENNNEGEEEDEDEDEDGGETDYENKMAVAIKTCSDNENVEIQLARAMPRKRSYSSKFDEKAVKKSKKEENWQKNHLCHLKLLLDGFCRWVNTLEKVWTL